MHGTVTGEEFKATASIHIPTKRFKTRELAEAYLEKMEAKLKEANKICDGMIWTNIELIYLTRWDCPTVRLAAA